MDKSSSHADQPLRSATLRALSALPEDGVGSAHPQPRSDLDACPGWCAWALDYPEHLHEEEGGFHIVMAWLPSLEGWSPAPVLLEARRVTPPFA